MVRQEEEEASPDALVVLDRAADRWDRPGDEPDPAFEAAITLCASVALRLVTDGYSVDVVDTSGAQLGALRGHEEDREDLMVALAMTAPRGEPHDLRSIVGSTPPGPLVFITGRLEVEDAERLITAGAAAPLLFAADAGPEALAAAADHGWNTALLSADADIAQTWADALPVSKAAHA